MQPTRNMRHVCPITSPSMKKRTSRKSTLPFSLDRRLLQQGEGYIGRTMPPQPEWTAQPSSAPSGSSGPQMFRNDHRNDTTSVQVQLRQLRLISSNLQNLETLSERFACTYNWSKRYTHLRGNGRLGDSGSSSSSLNFAGWRRLRSSQLICPRVTCGSASKD